MLRCPNDETHVTFKAYGCGDFWLEIDREDYTAGKCLALEEIHDWCDPICHTCGAKAVKEQKDEHVSED